MKTDLPFQSHSDTSRAAAESMEGSAGTLRRRVLEWLRLNGPATDEQIQIALGMNPSTERPRRIELRDALLVVDTGKRRPTSSGRMAVLWAVAPPPETNAETNVEASPSPSLDARASVEVKA